jgi:50S ribosomal subunit-associated GTPase HflX
MNKWISEVERYACDTIVRAFIGNKIDEPSQRIVGPDEAQRYAEEHKVPHFEVSAKSGEGIEYLTTTIAEMLLDKVSE